MDAPEGNGTTPAGEGALRRTGPGRGWPARHTELPPETRLRNGTALTRAPSCPRGVEAAGRPGGRPEHRWRTLDTISQGLKDVGTGIWDAGADFVTGIKDDAVGLWEGAKKLWNEPGQWSSDAKDSIVEGAKNTWNQVTTDPGGFFLDLLVSDEVQEDWKNGDKTHAVAQGIAENLIGLIPGVGWYKKATGPSTSWAARTAAPRPPRTGPRRRGPARRQPPQ